MNTTKLLRTLFTTSVQRPRTVRLGLDNLERRDTPSGTVTATLAGKTWTIIGDDQANDITIDPTGNGTFTLVGNNTAVSGDTDPTGVENIIIKMKQGADAITFNTTGNTYTLAGHLKINGGSEANYVYIANMTFNKNVNITNGTNTSGEDENYLEDTTVNGKVTITNGKGNTYNYLYRNTAGTSSVGSVQITNGFGYDANYITDVDVNGNVLINNGLPNEADLPGKTQFYNAYNDVQSSINGNISVRYKGGVNPGGERDGIWDYDVSGNVSFGYGSGQGDVRFDGYTVDEPAMIGGNLTIQSANKLVVLVGNQGYMDKGLWVGGKLSINSGAEADQLFFTYLDVAGPTIIKTGAGSDHVTIDDSILGQFTLRTAQGSDLVDLDYSDATTGITQFTGIVKVYLGNDDDQLRIGFAGDDTSKVEFFDVATFWGGKGTDTFDDNNLLAFNNDPVTFIE